MTSDHWRKSYGDLIDRLPAYVSNARTAICGLATCVDAYVRLDEAQALLNAETATPQAALAKELFRRAAAGRPAEPGLRKTSGSQVGAWGEQGLKQRNSFKKQVEISCKAGASGYLAGRSIWRDAASTHDPKAKDGAIADAIARLAELNVITRVHGRPYLPTFGGAALHEALPEFWYEGWHP